MITTINEFKIFESNRAKLYHGIKIEYAINALENNKLDTYTFQRFWPNGKRLKDNDPEYNNSHYYRGLSLTRDIKYAMDWSDIIFVFNTNKLRERYKIIPYNWGYSIGSSKNQNIKREREEFLVTSTINKPLSNIELANVLKTPGGTVKPLSTYLEGFYISEDVYDIYTEDGKVIYEPFEKLKKNPLYLGLI